MKMKKTIRAALLISAVLCVVLLFTGCRSIDDLREHRMNWSDEKHTAIEYNGETYKKLPDNEYFYTDVIDFGRYFVCDSDVPLLLATEDFYGTSASITSDGTIIYVYGDYFALESEYQKYCDLFRNAKFDSYCIRLDRYDKNGNFYQETEMLDDGTVNLINESMEKKVKEDLPDYDSCYFGEVSKCDSTGLLKSSAIYFYCIEDTKQIFVFDESGYYRLPDEYYNPLSELVKKCGNLSY